MGEKVAKQMSENAANLLHMSNDGCMTLNESKDQIRDCINAILNERPIELCDILSNLPAFFPPSAAESIVLQAWRKDKTNNSKGKLSGLVSAFYIGITKLSCKLMKNTIIACSDPASMLICCTALKIDDPELLAIPFIWDDEFRITYHKNNNRRSTEEVANSFANHMQAHKCAAFWRYWHIDRAAGHAPNNTKEFDAALYEIPNNIRGIALKRLSICYTHPTYTRSKTLVTDLTKTVLMVQFSSSDSKDSLILFNRREEAEIMIRKNGYFVLERCNMRIALYDNSIREKQFINDMNTIADSVKLVVAHANRIADPGRSLLVTDWEEDISLCERYHEEVN